MNKVPTQLSYLVIFNPTLIPPSPTEDEDEIEQAHILFYASRSRAVSRDTMLRQVGLAKALINFSALFTHEDACDNVHSQQKRMIMISPEPKFWIHACIDLSRTTRPTPPVANGKGKAKEVTPPVEPSYDYLDHLTVDQVIRVQLLRAYEEYKLLHGSFDEVLQKFGKSSLEHTLEQFFNVWALKWDLDATPDLASHLGLPIYDRYDRIKPLLDDLFDELPPTSIPFILQHDPPQLLNMAFSAHLYPPSLPLYLLSLRVPLSLVHQPQSVQSPDTGKAENDAPPSARSTPQVVPVQASSISASTFLPNIANPKKWTWPDYLSLRRHDHPDPPSTTPNSDQSRYEGVKPTPLVVETHLLGAEEKTPLMLPPTPTLSPSPDSISVHPVDQEALEDAITTEPSIDDNLARYPPLPPSPPPPPPFIKLHVHIADPTHPEVTEERTVFHVSTHGMTFALLSSQSELPHDPYNLLEQHTEETLRLLRNALDNPNASMTDLLLPATAFPSKSIVYNSRTNTTTTSPSQYTGSVHFFAARDAFEQHQPSLNEFISRTTSNQWHASRRGLSTNSSAHNDVQDNEAGGEIELYIEVGNTQASLVDVDVELGAIVRRIPSSV